MHEHVRVCAPASVAALLASNALANMIVFADATIQAHRDRQAALMDQSQTIMATAEAEHRELTEAEQREITGLTDEFDSLENQVNIRERVLTNAALLSAPRGRVTDPDDGGTPRNAADPTPPAPAAPRGIIARVEPRPLVRPGGTGGFHHLGDFANAVRMASRRGGEMDPRLRNAAASTYGTEGAGADGGFAVPPDFRSEIAVKVFGEDSLVSRTDRIRSSSNTLTLPTDMTTPWDSTGGIQAYWDSEAGTMTQSKPKLEEVTFKASKLHVLVPVSEELLEDAPAMDSYLRRKAPEKMDFKISDAIVRGGGAGMPLGFLNSPALVTVAAESGQAAGTIVTANISKMYARMPASSRGSAIWLINPDAIAQLDLLAVGQQPVYMPPGGISEIAYGRMKGRPVIEHEVCQTLGTLSDIMFVDLNQYMTLTKIGGGRDENGMKFDVSMHLWFDQDLMAFKFTIRIGGQPWWSTTTSPAHGSNVRSPYITLAAR